MNASNIKLLFIFIFIIPTVACPRPRLEYVNCGYTLLNVTSSALDGTADDECSMEDNSVGDVTRIFGPNRATFLLELQEVSGVNFPHRYSANHNATEMLGIRVELMRVLPGGGLIVGVEKHRMMSTSTQSLCPDSGN